MVIKSESVGFAIDRELEKDDRPTFPTNHNLVNDISNAELLKELLPALDKFHCLDTPVYKGKRCPWIRAFCYIFHSAGPWGENKFKDVPNHTSEQRHDFKSYIIPDILELLRNCDHLESSEPHRQLYNKLTEFKSKEYYYNSFMEACEVLAIEQTRKPPLDRAPIPKRLVELKWDSSTVSVLPYGQSASLSGLARLTGHISS